MSSSEISELFKLLSHPMRVKIIDILEDGPSSYTTLLGRLDNPSTGTLNFHLNKLEPLLEKQDNDLYRLNSLGEKATLLIEEYKKERGETKKTEVQLKQRESLLTQFIELPSSHIPLIHAACFILISFVYFLALSSSGPSDMLHYGLLLVASSMGLIFVVEKLYHSDRPHSLLVLALISFSTTWLSYTLIMRVSVLSDTIFAILFMILFFDDITSVSIPSMGLEDISLDLIGEIHPVVYDWGSDVLIILLSLGIAIGVGYYRYGEFVSLQKNTFAMQHQQELKVENINKSEIRWFVGLLHVILVAIGSYVIGLISLNYQQANPSSFLFLMIRGKLLVSLGLVSMYVLSALAVAKIFDIDLHLLGKVSYQVIMIPLILSIQLAVGFPERKINLIRLDEIPGITVIDDFHIDYHMSILHDLIGYDNTDYPSLNVILFLLMIFTALIHHSYHKITTREPLGDINQPIWSIIFVMANIVAIISISVPRVEILYGSMYETTYVGSPSNLTAIFLSYLFLTALFGNLAYYLGRWKKIFGHMTLGLGIIIFTLLVILQGFDDVRLFELIVPISGISGIMTLYRR